MPRSVPALLSIAGSDSGGGAGIQADLKAFARCGVHGMTAITALTAQSTVAVTGVHPVPRPFIVEQVRAVVDDLGVDGVKIGMLGTAGIAAAVDEALDLLEPGTPVVIDPVMISESGGVLLDDDARALHALGPDVVVISGGHREEATDVLFDGDGIHLIPGERHPDGAAHGSGCTQSSALAAHLALGYSPLQAARAARAIAAEAVRDGLRGIGRGPGPVDVLGLTARRPASVPAARTTGV